MSETMPSNQPKYGYDYANKCDCSDDDNCGCSFPNNIPHDFDVHCTENQENSCTKTVTKEKIEIKTENTHLKKDSVCICSPQECECVISNSQTTK